MPSLDMSEALTEPSFQDTFSIKRRRQVVNEYGETAMVETTLTGLTGIITMGGDNSLNRGEDEEHQGKTMSIVTQVRLRGASKVSTDQYLPDLILWHGSEFLVNTVEDYTAFGSGWVQAEATSQTAVDGAP